LIVLGIDTALGACSAALIRDGEVLARRFESMERGHAERLFPMLGEIFDEAGVDWPDMDRIVVTVGPGSFTGTRVGLAAARAIGLAAGCPVTGVTTLEVVRAGAPGETANGLVAVLFDARRGGLYGQLFENDGTPLTEPFVSAPEDLAGRFEMVAESARPLSVIGTGVGLALTALAAWPGGVTPAEGNPLPDASVAARLGAERDTDAAPPAPLYLRPPDAVPAVMPGGAQ